MAVRRPARLHAVALENAELPPARRRTVDSWLLFKLTGEHVPCASYASRTYLVDNVELPWSDEMCASYVVYPANHT